MNEQESSEAGTEEAGAEQTYVVQSGDSLSAIAEEHYGDSSRWREIYEANREEIGDDPDQIQPGTELKIPA